ncbi:hypothetical protein V8G54_033573 [Vigna mungo]|uniref:CCHC-type domain-containing protein n=1 Tax=Vigna mungo TaxID=3915 RepID=A0AAQ3MP72_VIGMU
MANTTSSSTRQELIYESPKEIKPPLRDDLSPNQWRAKLIEFGAWLDTKLIKDAYSYKVIEELCCRMTGTLKECLGLTTAVLGALHEEFIGDGAVIDRKMRQEFFEMNLKNTYVASLLAQLQPELNRMTMAAQKDFSTMTMGQIHQMTKEAVNKLCKQHQYFSDLMNNKGKFGKACKKSYLEIKCKDKCSCQSEKNKGEKPYKRKEKNLKFFKKRNFRKRPQGQRCYLCGKKGHFAKSCPNKADKAIKLVTSLKIRDEEVESLYSEQSSPDEDTVFTLRNSSEEEYSEEETFPIFSTEEINSLNTSPPHPNFEVQILPTKFNKPVKAITYINTGAQKTMMNPDILPEELWSKKTSYFMAVDGKIFKTELITKTFIGIKFFPDCIIWAKVIGIKLPGKDIMIGMDIFSEADKLQILPSCLKHKKEFKPFVETSTLFSLSASPSEMEEIKKKLLSLCADNHGGFSHPRPLWKNPNFFVKMPFKLDEDVKSYTTWNDTIRSTTGQTRMSSTFKTGFDRTNTFQLGMSGFLCGKKSERVRGKKRLVIDYKPLNHFLQDDKFLIPKASSLPILLKESNIFSKFDLKSGFWQIGIDPSERHKTTFCIPNAQYQWTVLPFGLKVAPSLFQKAMTKIFEPILENAIIYIDDILLFSKDIVTHKRLCQSGAAEWLTRSTNQEQVIFILVQIIEILHPVVNLN